MKDILEQFPPSNFNNARQIIKGKLNKLKKFPSESRAQEIERLADNVAVDYSNADAGEPPQKYNG